MKKYTDLENITLGKIVHGGQCLAEAPDGRKVFVWGGLPSEVVTVRTTKKKKSYLEGVVREVIEPSPHRIIPKEPDVYLSSSPWQIMSYEYENQTKQAILEETFTREGLKNIAWEAFCADDQQFGYRNKIELGFWGDDDGIHYASYIRGTHGKQIISTNALANSSINAVLASLLEWIREFATQNNLRAGDLKTVVLRSNQAGEVVVALYCKKKDLQLENQDLPEGIHGIAVVYSEPKSPASIVSEILITIGDIQLSDMLESHKIMYDVFSFFQVNIPIFNIALKQIKSTLINSGSNRVIDLYSGVGSIGVAVGANILIESDQANIKMAKKNVEQTDVSIIHAPSERSLDYIQKDDIVIVDPPRAGLHKSLIEHIREFKPKQILYLSCNPITQARDIKLLENDYEIIKATGFNFFPRTPHIESLILLELR